jgi:hypothetical protein
VRNKQLWIYISLAISVIFIGTVFYIIQRNKKSYEVIAIKEGPVKEAIYGLGTVVSDNKFAFKGWRDANTRIPIRKGRGTKSKRGTFF